MDPISTTIIAAALPVVTDLLKSAGGAVARRFVGLSVDDQIKLGQADVARLQAVAALDQPGGTPSQWVVDLRASFRYLAAAALIVVGLAIVLVGAWQKDRDTLELGVGVATFPFGFIFGERFVLKLRAAAAGTGSRAPAPTPGA